jgi:hypothetical protein
LVRSGSTAESLRYSDFLARVALVVLGDRVDERQRRARAVALGDVAHALVDGGLQRVQAFLRAELVVDADDLELHAGRVPAPLNFSARNW